MGFYEIMQNLAIGIVGGLFSSVVVSVIFYVLTEYRNELNEAKDMIYPLYGIVALNLVSEDPKKINVTDMATKYLDEAEHNFSRFKPWRYKAELKEAMCEINSIISEVKYRDNSGDICECMLKNLLIDLNKHLEKVEYCEENFAKGFLKRVLKNKIIIAMGISLLAIIVIA